LLAWSVQVQQGTIPDKQTDRQTRTKSIRDLDS
jgi:hypothetical protein